MEGKLIKQKWYQSLLTDLRKLEYTGIVLTKWNIGKRIVKEEGKPGYGEEIIKNLATDLGTSTRELWYCVQFYKKCDTVAELKDKSWRWIEHKYLPLPRDKRIEEEQTLRNNKIANIEIRKGDFKKVLTDLKNIDAIITDPPYPQEYLNCFSELSKFAGTNLKDDGFVAVYSGQYHLPEVIKRLSEHLTYVWTFCLYHVGKKQLVNGVNIMCGWKPVLIFSKGKKKMRFSAYDVLISESREKASHAWQQSESGVKQLIEIFSRPGELIVDPFAGSGTFLKVAKDLGRKAIGAEIQ